MKFFKYILFLLLIVLYGVSIAADDCAFDQGSQRRVLMAMAKMYPGGQIDINSHQIHWKQSETESILLNYGGCYHLASGVTQTIRLSKPRTQMQVFALAKFMAKRYWDNQFVSAKVASDALIAALNGGKFTVTDEDGKTVYGVSDETYDELTVSHVYQNGIDTVSIVWFGAF